MASYYSGLPSDAKTGRTFLRLGGKNETKRDCIFFFFLFQSPYTWDDAGIGKINDNRVLFWSGELHNFMYIYIYFFKFWYIFWFLLMPTLDSRSDVARSKKSAPARRSFPAKSSTNPRETKSIHDAQNSRRTLTFESQISRIFPPPEIERFTERKNELECLVLSLTRTEAKWH